MSVSRETARKTTRLAQAAGVVMALAAVSVWMVNGEVLTKVPEPDANAGPKLPPAPEVQAGPPRAPELDFQLLNTVLWERGNPPLDQVASATPTPPAQSGDAGKPATPTTSESQPKQNTPSWRYIGQIVGPRTTHALLERQGLQRLVAAGGEVEGTRVLEIHKDYVVLNDGSGPRRVQLADATNTWEMIGATSRPALASPSTMTRPPGYAQPGRPGVQPSRPPNVPQPRPTQPPAEEVDELRYKMEELKRQREESGEIGAADPAGSAGRRAAPIARGGIVC